VVAILADGSFVKAADAKTLDLRDKRWQLMEDLLPVLQPLQIETSLLSTKSMPSSSTVYPLTIKLTTETLANRQCQSEIMADAESVHQGASAEPKAFLLNQLYFFIFVEKAYIHSRRSYNASCHASSVEYIMKRLL